MVDQPGTADGRWVSPGQPATVGAHAIPGGLIYVGRHVRAQTGGVEPALINPDLPVAASAVAVDPDPGPAPAYHLFSPATRAAYLEWLAGGRYAEVSPGLVLLFCFGLERRVLVDGGHDPAVRRELPVIAAEVRRLQARCGGGETLRGTLDRLLDLLELLTAPRVAPGGVPGTSSASGPSATCAPGPPPGGRTPAGMALRVALARFAAASAPVPVDWAHAWVRHHPSLTPRGVQARCPDEFDRLFALRYRDRHGAGLVPPDDAPGIRLKYQPANPGLTAALVCREDLPDVLAEPRSTRALGALVDSVAAALDPYRRWLARFPQGRGSLAAATVLPAELVDPDRGQSGALRVWAEAKLDGQPLTVIDAAEFGTFWSTAAPDRMASDEAAALLAVLVLLGLGVEPDVRFGAPSLRPGPAVLFRLGRPAADRPGPRFPAAAAVARCAAAVASAAGPVDPQGPVAATVLATVRDLAVLLRLDPGEDLRIMARLAWLLATGVDLDRLGRHTTLLDEAGREAAGRYLIAVAAAADPAVGPATVAMLTRVYRIVGLEPNLVFHRLHEQSLGRPPTSTRLFARNRPAGSPGPVDPVRPDTPDAADEPAGSGHRDEPVVVRPADAVAHGYALPWAAAPPPAVPRAGNGTAAPDGVPLDQAAIMRKLAESAAATAILTEIFDTDPPPDQDQPSGADAPSAVRPLPDCVHRLDGTEPTATDRLAVTPTAVTPTTGTAPPTDRTDRIAGLDLAHTLLLRALATRPSWTREEFASLAAEHGVLPNGALDLLNEIAIDAVGAPVIDDDATLAVNNDVLLELLA